MEMIRPNIWIGSMNTIRYAPAYMLHVGIQSVINVAKEAWYERDDFEQFKIPMRDGWEPEFRIDTHFKQCQEAVALLTVLHEQNKKTLVHCAEGKSRSVHVIATYLSSIEEKEYEQLWDEIRSYRPCVHKESFNRRYSISNVV